MAASDPHVEKRVIFRHLSEKTNRIDGVNILKEIAQSLLLKESNYLPCFECKRHPTYPEIPPFTLHEGNTCLICRDMHKEKPVGRELA